MDDCSYPLDLKNVRFGVLVTVLGVLGVFFTLPLRKPKKSQTPGKVPLDTHASFQNFSEIIDQELLIMGIHWLGGNGVDYFMDWTYCLPPMLGGQAWH